MRCPTCGSALAYITADNTVRIGAGPVDMKCADCGTEFDHEFVGGGGE